MDNHIGAGSFCKVITITLIVICIALKKNYFERLSNVYNVSFIFWFISFLQYFLCGFILGLANVNRTKPVRNS